MEMKRALITGILGQDGRYLSKLLAEKGYRVYGLIRRSPHSVTHANYLQFEGVQFLYGDLRDTMSLNVALQRSWPDEIYNLGAQSFVPPSWSVVDETLNINVGGLARILELVERLKPETRVYQASTSEMFGNQDVVADEDTPFRPVSPYGVSKHAAHELVEVYRSRGLFVVGGICFNHESPIRSEEYVTQKISRTVARWSRGSKEILELGNMKALRDWGYAGDYVRAIHAMLQTTTPRDYVVGTGEVHSVEEFLYLASSVGGIEEGFLAEHIKTNDQLKRKNELKRLRANPRRIKQDLGWDTSVGFGQLVEMMVRTEQEDIDRARWRGYELQSLRSD